MKIEEQILDQLNYLGVNPEHSIVLATSGGLDSMVCAHIFKQLNLNFALAHCNFQLRGADSEEDAKFVSSWGEENNIQVHTKEISLSQSDNRSIQMEARDLRYKWFHELCDLHGYNFIVTAHHLNDSIETSLLNIIRGTGVNGIAGIPPKNGRVIRPLINISKEDLQQYARENKISWREDRSNDSQVYDRNKIRHQLIPLLEKINPNLISTYGQNLQNWSTAKKLYYQSIQRLKAELIVFDELSGYYKIPLLEFGAKAGDGAVLFELIKDFGFNSKQCHQIINAIYDEPGKQFFSDEYVLLIDRLFLIIKVKKDVPAINTFEVTELPFTNSLITVKEIKADHLSKANFTEGDLQVDYDKLIWPVKIRKWKKGDKFRPLGSPGHKKLSDFFVDEKVDRLTKEKIWILESGDGNIAGVIGFRPDEKYKISKNTKKGVLITLK